jgi:ABC-type transport system substrate-binding protein
MSKPTGMVPLVSLWVCCYLLIHNAMGSAEPAGRSKLELSGATFGGTFRRMLGDTPLTLDPAFVTDIYGRFVINQIFEGLVQFDAHLNVIPAIAEFWEASQDGRTWTFALRRGVRFHHGDGAGFCVLLHPSSPGQ